MRRAGREVAAALEFDTSDQVRMATAVSELGRELIAVTVPVAVAFLVLGTPRPTLVVEFAFTAPTGRRAPGAGAAAAARLVDSVEEEEAAEQAGGRRTTIRLRKRMQADVPAPSGDGLAALQARLAAMMPVSAVEELRAQNAELIEALDDIRRRRQELSVLDAELERPTGASSRCTPNWRTRASSCARSARPGRGSGPTSAMSCGRRSTRSSASPGCSSTPPPNR